MLNNWFTMMISGPRLPIYVGVGAGLVVTLACACLLSFLGMICHRGEFKLGPSVMFAVSSLSGLGIIVYGLNLEGIRYREIFLSWLCLVSAVGAIIIFIIYLIKVLIRNGKPSSKEVQVETYIPAQKYANENSTGMGNQDDINQLNNRVTNLLHTGYINMQGQNGYQQGGNNGSYGQPIQQQQPMQQRPMQQQPMQQRQAPNMQNTGGYPQQQMRGRYNGQQTGGFVQPQGTGNMNQMGTQGFQQRGTGIQGQQGTGGLQRGYVNPNQNLNYNQPNQMRQPAQQGGYVNQGTERNINNVNPSSKRSGYLGTGNMR